MGDRAVLGRQRRGGGLVAPPDRDKLSARVLARAGACVVFAQ